MVKNKMEYYVICAILGDGSQEYCYEIGLGRVPAGEPIGVESDAGDLILLEGIRYDSEPVPNDYIDDFGEPDDYEVIVIGDKPVAIKNQRTNKISFLTGVTEKQKLEVAARDYNDKRR